MNRHYSYTVWGVGIEIDNNVKREEIEALVKQMMEGEANEKQGFAVEEGS